MTKPYKLYGIPASLYTAKARSYLRKQRVDFVEHGPSDLRYQQHIIPSVGRMILPVMETPDGSIVQDGADIIRYFAAHDLEHIPALPVSPLLRAISFVFELFGGEGMLRPAMHYRWNFDDINLDYLRSEFSPFAAPGSSAAEYAPIFEFASSRMRKAALSFGVTDAAKPVIEESYAQFLQLFSAHLEQYPYLLGSQPTLGDYAFMAPLYAHLYHDPAPGLLMRQTAPRVARWVERCNAHDNNLSEYDTNHLADISDTALPETLTALLRYIAEEYLPEISAHVAFANDWLAQRPDLKAGTNGLDKPGTRFIGKTEFNWRGIPLNTTVAPYRFYLLQFLQDLFDGAAAADQQAIDNTLREVGLESLLHMRTSRRVERINHLEVWENKTMANRTELWVDRTDLRKTQVVNDKTPALQDGEILVSIDKFGLTSNNVSYAVSGDMIGYWKYYPAEGNWGKVPVWGCADVIESNGSEIDVGERLWGFFPMASHAVLKPGKVREDQFRDVTEHRNELPALYNSYRRTQAEPEFVRGFENERCLLFPLFATSFVLYDYLIDNDFFGAMQVVIGSVSSKTGFGLAMMLKDDASVSQKVIGVTSAGNKTFVESLDCCDQIVLYGNESEVDVSLPTAYVDMSGNAELTKALHLHLGDNMVESCLVGATNWEKGGKTGALPGAKPTFFFAPTQIGKREKDWGPGVVMQKGMEASFDVATKVKDTMDVQWIKGADSVNEHWQRLLDNKVPGSTGLMACLLSDG